MSTPNPAYEDAPLLDLGKIVRKLLAKRWWLAGGFMLGAVIAGIIAFTMRPIYRGTVILAPVTINSSEGLSGALGQLGGLASVVGMNLGGGGADTQEAMAVLQSRELTERFIQDKNLLPRFFDDKWDAGAKKWTVAIDKQPTLGKAFKYFDTKVRDVSQDRKTRLVTLNIQWRNRNEAADWANELVNRLNVEMRERAIRNASASVQYLEKELETTGTVATRDAISRLMEAQIKQRMLANVTTEYAFRIVDRAIPPDSDDVVRPRKMRLIALGAFLGMTLAALWVLVSGSLRPRAAGPNEV
jgi:uncharacterized protein involved in exopolysaccharide biosynthesis